MNQRITFLEEMADLIPEVKNDDVHISHFRIDENQKLRMMTKAAQGDRYAYTDPKRKYTRLAVNQGTTEKPSWKLMMTDTDMERTTNYRFLQSATGDVMVAGLGIAMIIIPLLAKKSVTSITIIEKFQGVIDAVASNIPSDPRIKIVHADIDMYVPSKGTVWDTIYFDIWPDRTTDNIEHINRLHRAFRKYKRTKSSWMGSWYHEELKYLRTQERRNGW